MKLYKVPLYKVSYGFPQYGKLVFIDYIIVQKGMATVKEVLTGYSRFTILSTRCIGDGVLDFSFHNSKEVKKFGYHFVVNKSDFVPKNHINVEDLNQYIAGYESSQWKKVYDKTKVQSKEKEKEVKQKVKSIFGSKK